MWIDQREIDRENENYSLESHQEVVQEQARKQMIASLTKLWKETDRDIDQSKALMDESTDDYIWQLANDRTYEKREALSEKLGRDLTFEEKDAIICEETNCIIQRINGEIEILVAKLDMIETQLRSLGARKARPYEHWNEEEHIVQFLETRNDNC